jgi:hypothetical protein
MIHYSDGYVDNRELLNDALRASRLCYIYGNAICRMDNTIENRDDMINGFINEYYFPMLGNCEYGSELVKLIQKHLIDDVTYNVEQHVRFQLRVKAPYVESNVPHICLNINSEERILNAMIRLQFKGVDSKYVLDLLKAG